MSEWRRTKLRGKRDASEPEIVAAFKAGGAVSHPISGENVPDLLVGFRGRNHLVECKTGNEAPSAGQATWHLAWEIGGGERVDVVRNGAQARKLIRIWTLEARTLRPRDDERDPLPVSAGRGTP